MPATSARSRLAGWSSKVLLRQSCCKNCHVPCLSEDLCCTATFARSRLAGCSAKARFDAGLAGWTAKVLPDRCKDGPVSCFLERLCCNHFCLVKVGRLEFKGTPGCSCWQGESVCCLSRDLCCIIVCAGYLCTVKIGRLKFRGRRALAVAVAKVEVSLDFHMCVTFCMQPCKLLSEKTPKDYTYFLVISAVASLHFCWGKSFCTA